MKFAKVKKLIATTLALSMIMTSSVAAFAEPSDGVAEEVVDEISDELVDESDETVPEEINDSDDVDVLTEREYNELYSKNPMMVMEDRSYYVEYDERIEDEASNGIVGSEEASQRRYVVPIEYIPHLRDQSSFGTCWAHGAMASIESNTLKQGLLSGQEINRDNIDFSEWFLVQSVFQSDNRNQPLGLAKDSNMENVLSARKVKNDAQYLGEGKDPLFARGAFYSGPEYLHGGSCFPTAQVLSGWKGMVNESYVPYSGTGVVPTIAQKESGESVSEFRGKMNNYARWLVNDSGLDDKDKINADYNAFYSVAFANLYRDNITTNENAKDTYNRTQMPVILKNANMFSKVDTEASRNALKELIVKNGIVDISYYAGDESDSGDNTGLINEGNYAYYCPVKMPANHEVSVVGWNDDYPATEFSHTAPGNGAWLFRNSWEGDPALEGYYGDPETEEEWPELVGDEIKIHNTFEKHYDDAGREIIERRVEDLKGDYSGYFWISYYDPTICDICSFEVAPKNEYDNNYFYDGGSYPFNNVGLNNEISAANVFEVQAPNNKGELLEAVNVYVNTLGVDCKVDIYLNPVSDNPTSGALVSSTEKHLDYFGNFTIDLDEEVVLNKGDKYAVVVTATKAGDAVSIAMETDYTEGGFETNANAHESYAYVPSNTWNARKIWLDLGIDADANICIKSYTQNSDNSEYKSIKYDIPNGHVVSEDGKFPYYYKPSDFEGYVLEKPIVDKYYDFEGWYADREYTTPIKEIPADSSEDIVVYAKVVGNDNAYFDEAREAGIACITDTTTLKADDATSGKVTVNKGAAKLVLKGQKGSFNSNNKKVVAVNKKSGKLSIKKPGEADITYTAENGATVVKHIVVQEPKVPKLSKTEKTVKVGESKALSFVSADANKTFDMINATWEPKGKKKTVEITPTADHKGVVVKGLLKGSATITATINNKKYNFKVKVVE